ncbi:hypothetical protein F5984_00150 [Rudanella paleaurantiibacter]|uniref:Uncharacterized protein n=1 Tax=Rudanella paleaurantiibacter TaxID=2614655 RepID=A0A7J5U3S0_9BACT|nr:hypothetical protein [Rudanella paleaurantiibacter]KAB7732415.1 hypothetical protein F5984_00150 [Rudanella paleaurantiibacter]
MKEGLLGAAVLSAALLLVAALQKALIYLDLEILPGEELSAAKYVIYTFAATAYLAKAGDFLLKRKRTLIDTGSPTSSPIFRRMNEDRRH